MKTGCLNVVLDAFWGSSGKGKVCDWLAATRGVTDLVSGNMPNAGHTVVRGDKKRVAKVMPSASFFNKANIWLSASSGFTLNRFNEELEWLSKDNKLFVHDRAMLVTDEHARHEKEMLSHVSSTMQGSAAALVDKIMRGQKSMLPSGIKTVESSKWRRSLALSISSGCGLYEVAQGWGLSIDHGTEYPYCTSRNCSTNRALDDAAIPPQLCGDVIAVIRPYPIRVGNTPDGYSGGWMPDCAEVSWEHVKRISGVRSDLEEKERTTVTKRIRRVATFSFELLYDCVIHNGVNGIFLNFGQYINASCTGQRGKISQAPKDVRIFVDAIEQHCKTKVIAVGTGADTFDVLEA